MRKHVRRLDSFKKVANEYPDCSFFPLSAVKVDLLVANAYYKTFKNKLSCFFHLSTETAYKVAL